MGKRILYAAIFAGTGAKPSLPSAGSLRRHSKMDVSRVSRCPAISNAKGFSNLQCDSRDTSG